MALVRKRPVAHSWHVPLTPVPASPASQLWHTALPGSAFWPQGGRGRPQLPRVRIERRLHRVRHVRVSHPFRRFAFGAQDRRWRCEAGRVAVDPVWAALGMGFV